LCETVKDVTVCFRNFTPSCSDLLVPILIASLGDKQKSRENVVSVVVTLRGYSQICLVRADALGVDAVDAEGKQFVVNCVVTFLH